MSLQITTKLHFKIIYVDLSFRGKRKKAGSCQLGSKLN